MLRYIQVKAQFIGLHKWDEAPDSTAFLRNLHRHLFIVRAKIEVEHNDRELEFFAVQEKLRSFIDSFKHHDCGSCEMIAENLLIRLEKEYPDRFIEVSVSEDDESMGVVNNLNNV